LKELFKEPPLIQYQKGNYELSYEDLLRNIIHEFRESRRPVSVVAQFYPIEKFEPRIKLNHNVNTFKPVSAILNKLIELMVLYGGQ